MKTKLVTVREGEYLGPIDWSYDFTQHDWGNGKGGVNPLITKEATDNLETIESWINQGMQVQVSLYGTGHKVLLIGMYDGWPFWKPVPSLLLETWLGAEWHPWYSIRNPKVIFE